MGGVSCVWVVRGHLTKYYRLQIPAEWAADLTRRACFRWAPYPPDYWNPGSQGESKLMGWEKFFAGRASTIPVTHSICTQTTPL